MNVDEIMAEIRSEIAQKKLISDVMSFEEIKKIEDADRKSFDFAELSEQLRMCNATCFITAGSAPDKGIISKAVMKHTRPYVESLVQTQNEFNAYAVRSLNCIDLFIREYKDNTSLSDIKRKLSLLELKVSNGGTLTKTDLKEDGEQAVAQNCSVTSEASGAFNYDEMMSYISTINNIYAINPERPIEGSFFKRFVKKAVRKCIQPYIEPLVHLQNNYNAFTVRTLNQMAFFIGDYLSGTSVQMLDERIQQLNKMIDIAG